MTRLLKIEKGRGPDLEIFVISVSKFLHFWIQRGRKPRKYRRFKKFWELLFLACAETFKEKVENYRNWLLIDFLEDF